MSSEFWEKIIHLNLIPIDMDSSYKLAIRSTSDSRVSAKNAKELKRRRIWDYEVTTNYTSLHVFVRSYSYFRLSVKNDTKLFLHMIIA